MNMSQQGVPPVIAQAAFSIVDGMSQLVKVLVFDQIEVNGFKIQIENIKYFANGIKHSYSSFVKY